MDTELTGGASAPRWARDTAPQPKPHRPRCAGVSLGFPTPILFRGHRRRSSLPKFEPPKWLRARDSGMRPREVAAAPAAVADSEKRCSWHPWLWPRSTVTVKSGLNGFRS